MWQSERMKKLRRILAGWLCVLLVMSLNISSLAEREAQMPPAGRSSVLTHTPADTEGTGQTTKRDQSEDPQNEATPGDADEDLINDLISDGAVSGEIPPDEAAPDEITLDEATPSEATPADADLEWSVEELQKRIDALPEVRELEGEKLGDYLLEVYQEAVDIRELIESLSEDEQALLDVGKLEDLERFFAEAYPAVFAAENGRLLDTGIMDGTLRWSVYDIAKDSSGQKMYSLVYTWEGEERTAVISSTYSSSQPNYLSKYGYYIKKVTFPEDGDITLGAYAVSGCTMAEIEFPDSVTRILENALYRSSYVCRMVVSGSIDISGNIFSYEPDRLEKLIFTTGNTEKEGYIGEYVFRSAIIKELAVADTIKTIGTGAFLDNKYLKDLDLGSVRSIGQQAFKNNTSLRKLVIPDTVEVIGSEAFAGCNIERLEFRGASDEGVSADAIEILKNGVVIIGKETKKLTGSLFQNMDGTTVLFEGDHVIEINGVPENFHIESLRGLNGTFHVDSQGVLYSQDDKKLIYCPPGITAYVVPETVETIGTYAFSKAEDLAELTFAAPQNMISLEDRAFFDCKKLSAINGKTTVTEIVKLFSGCQAWGRQLFLNTALSDAPRTGGILQTEKILLSRNADDARMEFGFANGATTVAGEKSFVNLTGDPIRLVVNAGGPNIQRYQYRIYLEPSGPDCSFGIKVDETLNLGTEGTTTPVTLRESDVAGIYYLEFSLEGGSTVSFDITPLYPSPGSPGGTLIVWGAILTEAEAETVGKGLEGNDGTNFAQMVEWKTDRNTFRLKNNGSSEVVLKGDGTADGDLHVALNAGNEFLTYMIDLVLDSGSGSQDSTFGKDYVQKIHCENTMELPPGMHWQPEVLQAIQLGLYYSKTNNSYTYYYVYIDGEEKQIARMQNRNFGVTNSEACVLNVVDNAVMVSWDLISKAVGKEEIAAVGVILDINSECLRVTQGDTEYGWDVAQTLTNRAEYTLQYAYSGNVVLSAESETSIAQPQSDIILLKSRDGILNKYRGDKAGFTITLQNRGAIAHNGLVRLEDAALPNDFYIRPENIERLFREQPLNQRLELSIAPVYLYETLELGTAIAMDGTTTVPVTPDRSDGGVVKTEHGRLVFAWEENKLMLNVYYEDQEGAEKKEQYPINLASGAGDAGAIQAALDKAGYVVTYGAKYRLAWDLEGMSLYGGQVIEIALDTALKDTFQYLQHSQRETGDFSKYRASNQARLTYREDNELKTKNASDSNKVELYNDFHINKTYTLNGTAGEADTVLFQGSLVDYTVSLTHSGDGDSNNLPLVDIMKGPQQLLAPAEANKDAEWAVNLEPEEIDGTAYYVLTENGGEGGVYKKVWIGTDEKGMLLCADSVKLTRETGQLKTIITWYYHNLSKGNYERSVTYKVRLKISEADIPSSGSLYLLNNEVWINARPEDYLFNYVGMYITEFSFEKEIVISPDGAHTEELAKHSVVKKGDRVKYRLSLDLYSNMTGSIDVPDAKDVLPQTYGQFEWSQDNVEISHVDGQGNSLAENFAWHIEKTDASGQKSEIEADNTYYTICWDKLKIPVGDLAIYVTLDFPAESAVWDSYADMNDGRLIYNRFYIGSVEKYVSHELAYTGRVYLQKGVYQIGHFSKQRQFMPTNTNTHYINENGSDPRIVYYIQLYNGGKSRLYLTEIQDQLPKGFTLQDSRTDTGYLFPTKTLAGEWGSPVENYTYTCYASGSVSSFKPLVAVLQDGDQTIEYKTAKVTVQPSDNELTGAEKLTFTFGAGNSGDAEQNAGYDPDRNLYYLEQGEALSFAYAVDTGKAEETEDYAENTIAMPYLDYSGGGVDAARDVTGSAQNEGLDQNVGLCQIMGQTEALQKGFFIPDADENQKWLSSDVTVERGMIVPGITEAVSSYTNESGIDIAYTNGAGLNDKINWKLNLYNNGQVPLVGYTVKDVMEFPYKFTGEVTFTSYYKSGASRWVLPVRLFTIEDRRMDADTGKEVLVLRTNGGYLVEIPMAESETVSEWEQLQCDCRVAIGSQVRNGRFNFHVRFYQEAGREVMEVRLDDLATQILAGEHAVLEFSTRNTTLNRPYKIYGNNAIIRPVQPYKESFVTQGFNMTDETGKNAGVKNSAHVVISGAYATSSLKSVEQTELGAAEPNRTDSTQEVNYILLPDQDGEFRYTLTVNNDNQNRYSIGELVFIDNLPEPGDHTAFSEEDERGSRFKVSLAANPNVEVQIEAKNGELRTLPSESYKVEYTEKTVFEDADWKGAGTGWSDTYTSASRSLRVHILPTTDRDLIPEGARVHVTFSARADGKTNAGDIAWNSFGYFYKMIDETAELFSAPQKVGIKIPEVPILEKRLISKDNEPIPARQDETFRFLIHEGPVLDGVDYNDENAVKAALSGTGAPAFTVVSVTVRGGDTSGQTVLTDLKKWSIQDQPDGTIRWAEDPGSGWIWTDRTQYTIAELNPGADYQFFRLYGSTRNGVSFYHQDVAPVRLDCENRLPGWSILLKKVDSKVETTLLPGAVFALYSPLASDQIQEGGAAYDAYLALSESERPALTFEEPGTSGGAGGTGDTGNAGGMGDTGSADTNWYLADIRTTGESGTITWDGLSEDAYRLKEVRAPKGYQMKDTGYVKAIRPERQDGNTDPLILLIQVKNASAYVLPKTGGSGTLPISFAGLLCLCCSGLLYKRKRTLVSARRKIETDGE